MINSISNIGGYISTAPNGNAFVITGIAAVLIGYEMYSKKINLVGALMGQKILIASLVIDRCRTDCGDHLPNVRHTRCFICP